MPVAYRQQVGSNTADLPKPSALADGDLLLAFVYRTSTTPASAASGWSTLLTRAASSGSSVLVAYKQVTNAAGEPATYTFTNATNIVGVAIYGHRKGYPFFFSESQATTSTGLTFATSGFTLDSDDYYAFACIGSSNVTGFNISSAPTNWTHLQARQRMKAARYDIPSGTYSNIAYPFGTSSVALVGAIVIVNPEIVAPTMTSTATTADPTVAVGARVSGEASQASSGAESPVATGGAVQLPPAPEALLLLPDPGVSASAVVAAAESSASGLMPGPSVTTAALQLAPVVTATIEAIAPAVTLGALIAADTQNAFCLSVAPSVTGGATVASGVLSADGALLSPTTFQSLSVPLALASASALGAAAFGGAILAPLHGTASMGAVAPKAGVNRTGGTFSGNYVGVTERQSSSSATARVTSATVTSGGRSATIGRDTAASVTVSRGGVTATQEESP